MTHADVFVQILSEVTGHAEGDVREWLQTFRDNVPGSDKFDDELSDQEAEALLADFRKEKSGILNWALKGGLKKKT